MKATLVKCVTKFSALIIAMVTVIVYQELVVKEFAVNVRKAGRASAAMYQNAQVTAMVTVTVCMEHATATEILQGLNAMLHFVPTNAQIMVSVKIRQRNQRAFAQGGGRKLTAVV